MKRIIISFILLYQKIAPKNVRKACRFEPSCSNYAIIAINKYGLVKGVNLGIKRIFKCRIPNGGYDYP
jgi:putative membrane protein insertion efficiency factor